MTIFCTYFDRNYLTRGLVLYESLAQVVRPFKLVVLALDVETENALTALALPGVDVVPLTELEAWDPKLLAVKPDRSRIEYYFTLTPALPLFVFDRRLDATTVVYVDADLRFYSDPTPLLEELNHGDVLIVPHGFPRHLEYLRRHGTYNVGLLAFRRTQDGLACLRRWHAQCLEWCYDRVEGERYADQGYLDDWPERFPGTIVASRPGVGLAPWNFMRYSINTRTNSPLVDGDRLVFYHFQGVKQIRGCVWDSGLNNYGTMISDLRPLYRNYVSALIRQATLVRRVVPGINAGESARGLRPRSFIRRLIQRQLMVTAMGRTW